MKSSGGAFGLREGGLLVLARPLNDSHDTAMLLFTMAVPIYHFVGSGALVVITGRRDRVLNPEFSSAFENLRVLPSCKQQVRVGTGQTASPRNLHIAKMSEELEKCANCSADGCKNQQQKSLPVLPSCDSIYF